MVDTQHFCLRWNNYQSSITSAFENLRDDEDFVDVTLACDGKSLKAHRVVLSACSPYFRELLKSTPCKHPVIVLQDVSFPDLHALVEFIYHGEVNVHQRSLSSFLKTAEVLRVSGLTQHDDTHSVQSLAARVAAAASPSTPASPSPVRRLTPLTPLPPHAPLTPLPLPLPLPPLAPAYADKLEEALSRRRARSPRSPDGKKPRHDNNNTERQSHMPPQAMATDFRRGAGAGADNNGNGVCGMSSGSPSPPGRHPDERGERDVKREPLELLCDVDGRSPPPSPRPSPRPSPHPLAHHLQHHPHHHLGPPHQHHHRTHNVMRWLQHGVLSRGSSADGAEERTPPPPPPPFLSPSETKLFNPAGTFNFSMAALADHSPLAGKKLFSCQLCGKVLCSKASLKRHIADKHAERQEEYRCAICDRVYCSRNSLMTHIYTYHKSRPGELDVKFF